MDIIIKDFSDWRTKARELLKQKVSPKEINWGDARADFQPLLLDITTTRPSLSHNVSLPKNFLLQAEYVGAARDPLRWQLLYSIAFRIKNENPHLFQIAIDSEISRFQNLYKSVRRDIHKMHAFVRFKEVDGHYIAWHGPEHYSLRLGSPFFVRRFGDKPWSIFTPDESAHWDLTELRFAEGLLQRDFEKKDSFDEIWKTYYRSTFNPARIKFKMMKTEMATKYWQGLPEAEVIHELVREAPARLQEMVRNQNKIARPPVTDSLADLHRANKNCEACPLHECASQVVLGQGSVGAAVMIVGEQPGDEEDLAGLPFVGPAGQVLNQALDQLQWDRKNLYVTNAVKHFKFEQRGKLRLHKKPSGKEVTACRPWLEHEIEKVCPRLIVALGATAGTSLLGRLPKISTERGRLLQATPVGAPIVLTWHPSSILRAITREEKSLKMQELLADLALAKAFIAAS